MQHGAAGDEKHCSHAVLSWQLYSSSPIGWPGGTGAGGAGVNLSGSFRNKSIRARVAACSASLLERSRQHSGDVLPQGNHFVAGQRARLAGSRAVCRQGEQMLDNRRLGDALHLALQSLDLRGLPGGSDDCLDHLLQSSDSAHRARGIPPAATPVCGLKSRPSVISWRPPRLRPDRRSRPYVH